MFNLPWVLVFIMVSFTDYLFGLNLYFISILGNFKYNKANFLFGQTALSSVGRYAVISLGQPRRPKMLVHPNIICFKDEGPGRTTREGGSE
jgi:hypothetical protein